MIIAASHLALANLILFACLGLAVFGWARARRSARHLRRQLHDLESTRRDEVDRLSLELDRALRARSTFLAAANHDLRQPLQALFCFSAILSDRVRGRTRVVAEQMQACLKVLNGHLESLVELSRLDAGIVEPTIMPVTLPDLMREMEEHFAPLAAAKGLRLRTMAAPDLGCCSDPVMLRRVLGNLIDNAVRFTSCGGVLVGCRRSGDSVRIEVWDSGLGIAAEQLPHVFEEFYQVGNPQRDRTNGLGLGLAVVERLVRILPGHRLDVRSRPGSGSCFAVQLPAARLPSRARASAPILRGPWITPPAAQPARAVRVGRA